MTRPIEEIEREFRESHTRSGTAADHKQDPLSFSSVVDEVLGTMRSGEYGPLLEEAVQIVRRNPGPALLIGAGIGWLLYRMSQDQGSGLARRVHDGVIADQIPVLNTGNARVYDPDHSPRHPAQDALESRREASARA